MGTGGKIAIGCAVAVVLAGIVTVVALGGLAFWVKGKAEQVTGEQSRIAELQRKANANRFTPPADGTIREDRVPDAVRALHQVFELGADAVREEDPAGEHRPRITS